MNTAAILVSFMIYLSGIIGWLNNVIWTFHQTEFTAMLIGIIGAIFFPLGVLHGLYLFF